MFTKKTKDETDVSDPVPPRLPDPDVRKRNVSVIGPTLYFKGELSANEDLVIEGRIEGSIAHQDKNLTVGKEGRIKADIHAKVVEILGEVEGDIRSDDIVRLAKSAKVKGNIQCTRIVMEDGARFTGNVDMSSRAKSEKQAALTVAEPSSQASGVGA